MDNLLNDFYTKPHEFEGLLNVYDKRTNLRFAVLDISTVLDGASINDEISIRFVDKDCSFDRDQLKLISSFMGWIKLKYYKE